MTYNLLIIDDIPVIRNGIASCIDWDAFDISIIGLASDGLEGLDIIRNEKVDIVITDINMPLCNGLEFVEKCKSINPAIEIIILSGYSDFKYAKKALQLHVSNYLLKPLDIDELIHSLEKIKTNHLHNTQANDKRERHIKKLISYNLLSREQTALLQDELSFVFPLHIIILKNTYGTFEHLDILPYCDDFEFYDLLPCDNDKLCILFSEKDISCSLDTLVESLSKNISQDKDIEIQVSIVKNIHSIPEISTAYQQALHYLSYSFYGLNLKIYDESLERENHIKPKPISNTYYETLLNLILNRKIEEIPLVIDQYFNELIYIKTPPPFFVLSSCNFLLSKIFKQLWQYPLFQEAVNGLDIYKDLQYITTLDLLKEWMVELLSHFAFIIMEDDSRNSSNHIEQAILFISQHITQKLTLEIVAKQCHLNKNYFATLFKESTGINFRNYLLNAKIEHAQYLLQQEYLSSATLARLLSYEEPRSFVRAFKNKTNKTPAEYAKLFHSEHANNST